MEFFGILGSYLATTDENSGKFQPKNRLPQTCGANPTGYLGGHLAVKSSDGTINLRIGILCSHGFAIIFVAEFILFGDASSGASLQAQ